MPTPFFVETLEMATERLHTNVTVAVSTFRRPEGLARCMTAILRGHRLPAQIVIVDQSPDSETAELVRTAEWDRMARVDYIAQPQQGLAASRNGAIVHAVHPIIAFTDDDCVPDEQWIDQLVSAFEGPNRPDAVTGRILPLGPERPGLYAVASRPSPVRAVYRGLTLPWAIGSGGNTAVTRQWLDRIGRFDERLGLGSRGRAAEDTDLLYRLLRAGATLQYEPAATVFHERQNAARRLASRPSYGFGMGAFCAKWARHGDAYAIWMLACWVFERARELLTSFVRLRSRRIREELLMLHGAVRGIAYGLRTPQIDEC